MFGLETSEEHAFSAEAVVDARVTVLKRRSLASLAAWDDEVSCRLQAFIARELQRAQNHFLLLIRTAPERMASFLLEMAERIPPGDEVELPMSRRDIGDHLGLTAETVSRTLTQLENQSVIAVPSCKRIVVRDRAALKRLIA